MNHALCQKIRWPLTVISIACLGWLMWGCRSDAPVLIGFIGGTSGHVADVGISGRDAVQMAVEQCNDEGGIRGRKIHLIFRDDRQDPEAARQAMRELVDEGVVAVVGPMTSEMAMAVTPLANRAGVLLMSPTVITEYLSGRNDWFFRVSPTTKNYAFRSAEFLIRSGRMHRVAVVFDEGNRAYSENWLENFRFRFTEMGGEVIAAVGFTAEGKRTFLEIVQEALAVRPDGLVLVANSVDSALLCQQVRKTDPEIQISLADWGATERLLELGGRALEGVTAVQAFDRASQDPAYQAFRQDYMRRYQHEPGVSGVNAYDAVRIVIEGLRVQKAGEDLREAILGIRRFSGLQGDIVFDSYGDALRPPGTVSIIRDQRFVVLDWDQPESQVNSPPDP